MCIRPPPPRLLTRSAFSLVELSIVLVVIGLLVGGVLAGRSLIIAAEMRGIMTDLDKYLTATYSFRDKYFAFPGDFRDATRFWGRQQATADCVTNSLATVNTSGSCDGSGNNSITSVSAANASAEELQYWRQLNLAGMLEGAYTGLGDPIAGSFLAAGSNIPAAKRTKVSWRAYDMGDQTSGVSSTFAVYIGNMLYASDISGAAFTPQEAWNIDTKMDDGKPGQGKVLGRTWSSCATAAARTELTADYNLASDSKVCQLMRRQIF